MKLCPHFAASNIKFCDSTAQVLSVELGIDKMIVLTWLAEVFFDKANITAPEGSFIKRTEFFNVLRLIVKFSTLQAKEEDLVLMRSNGNGAQSEEIYSQPLMTVKAQLVIYAAQTPAAKASALAELIKNFVTVVNNNDVARFISEKSKVDQDVVTRWLCEVFYAKRERVRTGDLTDESLSKQLYFASYPHRDAEWTIELVSAQPNERPLSRYSETLSEVITQLKKYAAQQTASEIVQESVEYTKFFIITAVGGQTRMVSGMLQGDYVAAQMQIETWLDQEGHLEYYTTNNADGRISRPAYASKGMAAAATIEIQHAVFVNADGTLVPMEGDEEK